MVAVTVMKAVGMERRWHGERLSLEVSMQLFLTGPLCCQYYGSI